MAKVVVRKFGTAKGGRTGASVTLKRIRDVESGQILTLRTIDGRSKTLGRDLDYVFSRNVAEARRENMAVAGVADRAPTED